MFLFTRKKKNPFKFVHMEKWCNKENEMTGYVGITQEGEIYLTWDVRDGMPVFSGSDLVGENLTHQAFFIFEHLQRTLDNRWIEPVKCCNFQVNGFKNIFTFPTHYAKRNIGKSLLSKLIPSI